MGVRECSGLTLFLSLELFAMVGSHFLPSPLISRSPDDPVDRPYVSFVFSQCPTIVTGLNAFSCGGSVKGVVLYMCMCSFSWVGTNLGLQVEITANLNQ